MLHERSTGVDLTIDTASRGPDVVGADRDDRGQIGETTRRRTGAIDHDVPSQCTVSVCSPREPTAHTSSVAFADTDTRSFAADAGPAFGLGTRCHDVPSQWSVSVRSSNALVNHVPTAHTSSGAIAVTADSEFGNEPLFGLGTTVHAMPSQCSMSVLPGAPCPYPPTAQTSSAARAVTPLRSPPAGWPAFGLITRVHEVPSQCSMSVRMRLFARVNEPTAQASDAVRAVTPDNAL